jgi:hypothetical protein
MKPLILTGWYTPEFNRLGLADLVVNFPVRFVWGPLPSPNELADYLGPHKPSHRAGKHWSTYGSRWSQSENKSHQDCGLAEFCQQYETVELWFDPVPNAQLQLIWLLDYFRSHPRAVARLKLRLIDIEMIGIEHFGKWMPRAVDVTERELAMASTAWQAYRAATPEGCFDLLRRDLSALPPLKPALTELMNELPFASTGLGATEMRMLEMVAEGHAGTNNLFHFRHVRRTDIFNEWEHGYLLDGLALGPRPAVAGLDDALRTISRENLGARHAAYLRSRLSLTDFGAAVVAHKEDFSRHNPIDRWWGGTRLTSDRLWRRDLALVKPKRRRRAP